MAYPKTGDRTACDRRDLVGHEASSQFDRFRSKQRKVQVIDMEVQDIELSDALPHLVKHQHMMRSWVTDIGIEAQSTGSARNESAEVMESPLAKSVTDDPA